MTVVNDYRAILAYLDSENFRANATEDLGTPTFISYSFVAPADLTSPAEQSYAVSSVFSFNEAQKAATRAAFAKFEEVAGIKFVEKTGEAMINAYAVAGSQFGGWADYPSFSPFFDSSGILVIDTTLNSSFTGFEFETVLHEIGHAVGLSHPFDGTFTLNAAIDSTLQTLMSYNGVNVPQLSLAPLDVEALQDIYGTPINMTNWTYGFVDNGFRVDASARNDHVLGVNGNNILIGRGGDDTLIGRSGDDRLIGGKGNDTLMGYAGSDFLKGGLGNDWLYAHVQDDINYRDNSTPKLLGGNGRDRLFGGDGDDTLKGGKGRDVLVGDFGDDTLNGGLGVDKMTGGSGSDVFVINPKRDGPRDVITDFTYFSDQIDLRNFSETIGDFTTKTAPNASNSLLIVDLGNGDKFKIVFQDLAKTDLDFYVDFYHDFG
ncbi:MAG: type I secretion protein [Arenibacterium sp.]